jgi:hypothetical protein
VTLRSLIQVQWRSSENWGYHCTGHQHPGMFTANSVTTSNFICNLFRYDKQSSESEHEDYTSVSHAWSEVLTAVVTMSPSRKRPDVARRKSGDVLEKHVASVLSVKRVSQATGTQPSLWESQIRQKLNL